MEKMRLLLCADIHGATELLDEAIKRTSPVDMVIIAGDAGCDEAEIAAYLDGLPYILVAGNNDFDLLWDVPDTAAFAVNGKKFLLTHGHLQYVRDGVTLELIELAKEQGADVVVFGHSHKYLVTESAGILFLNPGAVIGDPDSMEATCMILTITEEGQVDVEKVLLVDLREYLW